MSVPALSVNEAVLMSTSLVAAVAPIAPEAAFRVTALPAILVVSFASSRIDPAVEVSVTAPVAVTVPTVMSPVVLLTCTIPPEMIVPRLTELLSVRYTPPEPVVASIVPAVVLIALPLAPMPLATPPVVSATVSAVSVPAVVVIEPPVVPPLAVSIVILPAPPVPVVMFAPITAPPVPTPVTGVFTAIFTAFAVAFVVAIVPLAP